MHDFANVRVRLERLGQCLARLQVTRASARRHDQDTLHSLWQENGPKTARTQAAFSLRLSVNGFPLRPARPDYAGHVSLRFAKPSRGAQAGGADKAALPTSCFDLTIGRPDSFFSSASCVYHSTTAQQSRLGGTRHSRAGTTKSLGFRLLRRFISLVRLAALTNDAEVSYVNERPEKLTGKSNRIAPKSEI
jgi:hypothetical protein